VTGDSIYGNDGKLRLWLEEQRLPYVLGVTARYRLFTERGREWAKDVFAALPAREWRRLSCGAGSKGERVYDRARVQARTVGGERRRWLVARRSITDPSAISYYIASSGRETPLSELARVAGVRWAVEESFETAKGEVGLDHYEVRSWAGWYRHITLAILAHAYLSAMRAAGADAEAQKKSAPASGRAGGSAAEEMIPLTVPEVRRLPWWLVWRRLPTDEKGRELVTLAAPPSGAGETLSLQAKGARLKHLQLWACFSK
jgi:SRSO17 transposase